MKAVLFDMDGVLIDSETFYMKGTYEWMKEAGFEGEIEDVFRIIGTTMVQTYEIIQKMLDFKYTIKELEEINENYFRENPLDYKNIVIPGTLDLMRHLKSKGIKLAVCSASAKNIIDHVMEVCGFKEYLDYEVSGEEVKNSKPFPDIYLKASEVLGVKPEKCIVIEDSRIGIEAGKNAGMFVFAYRDPKFKQDQSSANAIYESMEDIANHIKTLIA